MTVGEFKKYMSKILYNLVEDALTGKFDEEEIDSGEGLALTRREMSRWFRHLKKRMEEINVRKAR